jgi:energy-coupling factor transporter ATP-binding protein EcfA2
MKEIQFLKAGMQNFCGYTDLIEYEFKNNKIVLITGPNGVGKSTIFDSIQFTLFGVTGKDGKSSDVVNNVVGKNCKTYIEFTCKILDNIDSYKVIRYVKDTKLGDTVLLFKNDFKKPYKKGHKEVLPEIEKILVPQKLFNNTLLFGQKVKEFFTDLPDSDRKEIFRKVIQADDYVLYYDETNKRIKLKNEELSEIEKGIILNTKFLEDTNSRIGITLEDIKKFELRKKDEINSLTIKISDLNDELLELHKKEKDFENINDLELDKLNQEISNIENEINKLSLELKNNLDSLENTKSLKLSEFNLKYQELYSTELLSKNDSISKINKEFQEYKLEIIKNRNELNNSKNNYLVKQQNNEKEIEKTKPKISELQLSLNKSNATCPTCGKLLTEESIKQHLTNSLNELIESNKEKLNENINLKNLLEEITKQEQQNYNQETESKRSTDEKIKEINQQFELKHKTILQRLNDAETKLNNIVSEKENNIKIEYFSNKNSFIKKLDVAKSRRSILSLSIQEKLLLRDKMNKLKSDISLNNELLQNKQNEEYNISILENYYTEKDRLETEKKCLDEDKLALLDELEILNFWKVGFSST